MTQQEYLSGDSAVKIAESVERAVREGQLGPGDAAPTVRALAARLGVSPTTVAAAYRTMRARGLLIGDGRRGTRIATRPPIAANQQHVSLTGVLDLTTGNPDPALLPSLATVARSFGRAPRLYGGPVDLDGLVAFAADRFREDDLPADAVGVVSGGLDGIERVLREHTAPGDRVVVEDPAFSGVLDLLHAMGLAPTPAAVDDEGMRPESLDAALRTRPAAVIITPRAHNPTGAALSRRRSRELRVVLDGRPDLLVIEDDHVGPVSGAPLHSTIVAGRARFAIVRSVSKFLGPDLRVAVVSADEETMARVRGRQALGPRWVSHLLQAIVLSLWRAVGRGRTLPRVEAAYSERRAALCAALEARGIGAHGRSGLNVWVPVREETSTIQGLLASGFAATPGERFRLRTPPAVRFTISALAPRDADRVADAVHRIARPPKERRSRSA